MGCAITLAAFLVVKARVEQGERVERAERGDFSWAVLEFAHDLEARVQSIFTHEIAMAETLSRLPPRDQRSFEQVVGALAPSCGASCLQEIGYFPWSPVESEEQWRDAERFAARPVSFQATMTVEPARTTGRPFPHALMVSLLESNGDKVGEGLTVIKGHHENLDQLLRRGDRVVLTEPLHGDLEANGGRPTVLVIAPVYRDWARLDTPELRQQALRALVVAGLGVDRVLADAMPAAKRSNVRVRIFDLGPEGEPLGEPAREGLLLDTETPLAEGGERAIPGPDFASDSFHEIRLLDLGGRHWGLYFSRAVGPSSQSNTLALVVLLFGCVVTAFAVLMVVRSQRAARHPPGGGGGSSHGRSAGKSLDVEHRRR
ncbi:MAG: CHASE domain-containing protein [Rhodospirillum sp.]|nr:CHASE domain-containing protein [Rhodospirillum sp.]MCF8489982.1 CHASE domain-containing protein [Rhodospirillum sp.]MCF8501524.1 CHASE domain-containing protein [Rhodospirillum sp.]